MHKVTIGDYDVLLSNVEGEVYAIENTCSHYGASLSEGALCDHRVRCPWHHACYDVRTGEQIEAPGMDGVAKFSVQVKGDDIMVSEQPEKKEAPEYADLVKQADYNNKVDYLIVGAGVAAAYAVEAIRAEDQTGSILMIGREALPPYDRTKVSKAYMQDDMPAEKLPLRSADYYQQLGVRFLAGTQVQTLDLQAKQALLDDGTQVDYDKVLVATGGRPIKLDVPGANLPGVHTVRSNEDAEQARAQTKEGTQVVVIGGSFIGLESAMSLGKRGGKVTVVSPEEVLFEKVFGERVGKYIQQLHEAAGVTFELGRKCTSIEGEERVTGVVLDNGKELPAEVVMVGIGVKPATDFVSGIAYRDDHSLTVDGHLLMHAEGAYAAGDIATYPDREGQLRIEHWKVAGQQGRIAGRNMAGRKEAYRMLPYFWSNQQGTNFRYAGHATDYDRIEYDGNPGAGPFLAFYLKDEHVQACLGVKRDADTAAVAELMYRGSMPEVGELIGQDWQTRCRQL